MLLRHATLINVERTYDIFSILISLLQRAREVSSRCLIHTVIKKSLGQYAEERIYLQSPQRTAQCITKLRIQLELTTLEGSSSCTGTHIGTNIQSIPAKVLPAESRPSPVTSSTN